MKIKRWKRGINRHIEKLQFNKIENNQKKITNIAQLQRHKHIGHNMVPFLCN